MQEAKETEENKAGECQTKWETILMYASSRSSVEIMCGLTVKDRITVPGSYEITLSLNQHPVVRRSKSPSVNISVHTTELHAITLSTLTTSDPSSESIVQLQVLVTFSAHAYMP